MKAVLLLTIMAYQVILSPYIKSSCRYYPTCSNYSYEAIFHYGCFKGLWLTFRRLLRCAPAEKGGYDPIPRLLDDYTN